AEALAAPRRGAEDVRRGVVAGKPLVAHAALEVDPPFQAAARHRLDPAPKRPVPDHDEPEGNAFAPERAAGLDQLRKSLPWIVAPDEEQVGRAVVEPLEPRQAGPEAHQVDAVGQD